MKFADKIIPRLGQSAENKEWYVNAIWTSLNEYIGEIESSLNRPQFQIVGTTTTPAGVDVPIMSTTGQISNKHIRLTYPEVKSAMWCGDAKKTFPNLFKLIGEKISKNFGTIYSTTIVGGISQFSIKGADITYNTCGTAFMAEIWSLGQAGKMNPELFHNTLEKYLNMAFRTIPPIVVNFVGTGIVPPGVFKGTANITFSLVK